MEQSFKERRKAFTPTLFLRLRECIHSSVTLIAHAFKSITHIPTVSSRKNTVGEKVSGFTLIELLVVIAIIGLLSSVVFASLNSARGKARDAKRLADLRQIDLALQLYFDQNGSYPNCNHYITNSTSGCLPQALINAGVIPSVPVDPLSTGGSGTWGVDYQYSRSGDAYFLRTALEGTPISRTNSYPGGGTCFNSAYPTCSWVGQTCVYATGGACNTLWMHYGSRP